MINFPHFPNSDGDQNSEKCESVNNMRIFTILPILRITAHALKVDQNVTNGFGIYISLVASHAAAAAQSTDARIIITREEVCRGNEVDTPRVNISNFRQENS